jgi:DNA polymerase-1
MKTVILDIEANGLLDTVTNIWMIVCKDCQTGEVFEFTSKLGNLEEFGGFISKYDRIVAHNGIGYDAPAINKVLNIKLPVDKLFDTFIVSQMLYANELHSHSLETHGKLLGFPKIDFDAYDAYSDEMLEYCRNDVELTSILYRKMLHDMDGWDWSQALDLEFKVYDTYSRHQTHWYLDVQKAHHFVKRLTQMIAVCDKALLKLAPIQMTAHKIPVKYKTSVGAISSRANALMTEPALECMTGDFCLVEFNTINLNSTKQVITWLLGLGWKPDIYNHKKDKRGKPIKVNGELIQTSPSLSNSSFDGLPASIKRFLLTRNQARHRMSTITGWINTVYDGNKIPTRAFTCGTNTARWRHSLVVNVPKAGSGVFFGDQMRSLFINVPGTKIVGFDFSQLEARIEGHATYPYDGGVYAKFLLEEDVHEFNAKSWGIKRSEAKGPGYALSYQCGYGKIKELLGCSDNMALEIWQKYRDDRPGMMSLIEAIENSLVTRGMGSRGKNGSFKLSGDKPWIRGIDGRKLYVRSAHSLKNTYIQNAGMIAVKYTYVLLDKYLKEEGVKARIVMVYHDECQAIIVDDAEQIKKYENCVKKAIENTCNILKLRVPLNYELKIGNNWRDCH